MKTSDKKVIFPVRITFEDGSTEIYADERELCCNLEEFNSLTDTECTVLDAEGRKVVLVLERLEVKQLAIA